MAGFDINSFKSNFSGGARAYLFMWTPEFPTAISTVMESAKVPYLVRATSLPEDSVEEIIVNWQGADFKMAGKRTFTDWTITLNTDKKALIRQDFNSWIQLIHQIDESATHLYGTPGDGGSTANYFTTQILQMLDYDGVPINTLKLVGTWLKSVSPITLDYSSMDIAQFDITFTYQYHVLETA